MLAAAIAHHLTSLGLVDYRPDGAGGDCFVQWLPDQPPEAVSVWNTGGLPQPTRLAFDDPSFQVRARGDRFDVTTPHDRLAAIYDALTCLDGVTIAAGTPHEVWVIGISPLQSSPISIGRDDNQRPEWTQNYSVSIANPTAHRPQITA